MKYQCEVIIKAPRDRVVELFDNPDHLHEWQDGFQNFEHLSGNVGQPGAKSKMTYINNGKEMIITETISVNALPEEFSGTYEFEQGANTMSNHFYSVDASTTRYVSITEYYEINSIMMRIMIKLFPSMFKNQTQKWMNQFKEFVESNNQ